MSAFEDGHFLACVLHPHLPLGHDNGDGLAYLLTRLAMRCLISVAGAEVPVLTVHGLKSSVAPSSMKLQRTVLDAERWQCWRDRRPTSFIHELGWMAGDLVQRFMPMCHLEQLEGGPELVSKVQAFLALLGLPEPPRPA